MIKELILGGVRNSASLRSLPRLLLGHITSDKRLRYASPKFAYRRASFIRKSLCERAS